MSSSSFMEQLSAGWNNVKAKASGAYDKMKAVVTPKSAPLMSNPLSSMTTATATTGGSKRRHKSKKTKRVRFSKRRRVYKYKTMRRK